MAETILTAAGARDLEAQLELLKTVTRKEVAEQIKKAREFGDISENAEYDEAKNEQARIEGEIIELEKKLRSAMIINSSEIDTTAVTLGTHIFVEEVTSQINLEFTIVGSTEASPAEKRISNESPVGAALLGHGIDDIVEIKTPGGVVNYKILKIERG